MSIEDRENLLPNAIDQIEENETNWVDEDSEPTEPVVKVTQKTKVGLRKTTDTVVMVETAFLASAASLVWLIDSYFPVGGPLLKIFFPIPIALIYLRRGNRASWMAAIVSGLLLTVLMGPTRSIYFTMPYGLMGVLLGACWQRRVSWLLSIGLGTVVGTLGLFFRFWLNSILVGENLWVYAITQITQLLDWIFFRLGILAQPDFALIQTLAIASAIVQNLIYLFAVHLVALMLLDRLDNPISRPPEWVRVLLDY